MASAGTCHWMAPEVFVSHTYDEKAGILRWPDTRRQNGDSHKYIYPQVDICLNRFVVIRAHTLTVHPGFSKSFVAATCGRRPYLPRQKKSCKVNNQEVSLWDDFGQSLHIQAREKPGIPVVFSYGLCKIILP